MAADDDSLSPDQRIARELARVRRGGAEKYHRKNAEQKKLFARERLRLLLDEGSFVEDGALANALDPELPADGVVTGIGTVDGRSVALMANDSTVKAGMYAPPAADGPNRRQNCGTTPDRWTSLQKMRPAPRRPGNISIWSVMRAPAESTR